MMLYINFSGKLALCNNSALFYTVLGNFYTEFIFTQSRESFKNKRNLMENYMAKRVTIIKIRRIEEGNVNRDLQWLGNSFGLFNMRDKDSSCFRIFITLVKKSKSNEVLSSDEIAEKLNLSRGTVVHHLTRLMDSGIVVKERKGYLLRESSLGKLVGDIQQDIESMFSELQEVADEIDEKLG